MSPRLAALFLLGAGLAVAGPDGACTILPANILSPQSKVTRGVPVTIAVNTSGCTTPLRAFQLATGTLPPGLSLIPGTTGAQISGTPTASGVYSFTLRAIDSAYKLPNESAIIQVSDPLQFDTPAAATGAPSAAYSDTIRVRGGVAPYAFSIVAGSLPSGLNLNASTGAITGTMPATGSTFRVRVTDSAASIAEKPYTIAPSGLVTTVATPPVGSTGSAYSFDIDGALGTAGFAVALGALPPGLAIDTNGLITGTPTTSGESHFTVRQTAGTTSVWRSYRIFVNSAATISGTPRSAEETASYNHVFTVTGGVAPYSFALTAGSLPTGLSLDAATGSITGTLPVSASGTAFTVSATDASGRVYSQPSSIATVTKLVGTASTVPTIRVPFSATASPYSLSAGGPGKQFALIGGPGSQQIVVDPVTGTVDYSFQAPGIFFPTVLATDSLGGAVLFNTVQYKAVDNLKLLTAVELPNGRVGLPYSAPVSTANADFGPLNFSVSSGILPTGLSLNAATGIISGTPEGAAATLTFPFQVTVADSLGQTASANYFIGIGAVIRITTTKLPDGTAGVPFSGQVSQANAIIPSFTAPSGGLPPGLAMDSAGTFTGTPTLAGDYTFLVQLNDLSASDQDAKQFTMHIANSPTFGIAPPVSFEATTGTSVALPITQVGGRAPSTLFITGGILPDGLFTAASGSSLSISGVPMVEGTQSFTINISDADGRTGTIPYTINVRRNVRITTDTLPAATRTVSYSTSLSATSGLAPYSWTVSNGTLPTGLTLSPAGLLAGTPTAIGPFNFTISTTDSGGRSVAKSFLMEVRDPLVITNGVPLPNGVLQSNYNTEVTTAGGAPTRTYSILANDIAPLISLDPNTGVINGLPLLAGTFPFTVQVQDNQGRLATQAQQITIQNALSFSPITVPNGAIGAPYSVTFTPLNAVGAVTWAVIDGALPPGITLGAATGILSGTPTASGPFNFTVQAVDSSLASINQNYTLTVLNALTIAPATLPPATINSSYTQQLTATGGSGAVIWTISAGALPPGLALGPTSGAITGTPTTSGTFPFTVTATDSFTQTGSRAYTFLVNGVLTLNPASLPTATVNTPYSQQLSAAGAIGAVTWAVTAGALPAGLTLNPTTGLLSGTPTAPGAASFAITATDTQSQTGVRGYGLQVLNVLTITPATLPNATVGTLYSQTLIATGGGTAITWAVIAGALPAGLTLNPTTGLLSGNPTTPGPASFTLSATDTLGQAGSRAYSFLVGQVLISPLALPPVYIGVPYSQTLTAPGAVLWSILAGAGSLPPGLTLNPTTGVISGTSTGPQGTYNFRVQATDASGQTGQQVYDLLVLPPVTITPATLPNATLGTAYSQTLTASGALGTATFTLTSGTLPAGLTLAASGALTGTPTASGVSIFDVTVTTTQQQTATRNYRLTVVDPLSISTTTLPDGTELEPYSATLTATAAATSGLTWSISAGALPPGLTLGATTGAITGTPTNHGSFPFTAQVATSTGSRASQALTLVVVQALTITSLSLGDATQGKSYTTTLTAAGGRSPYTWSLAGTSLPAGLQLSPSTGLITGTASAPEGSYPQNVVVTDSRGRTSRRTLTLTISEPPPPSLVITPDTLPNGRVNQAYSASFSGSGGRPGYTFSLVQGSPPSGLSLSGGTLSGTPSQDGTFRFTVNVTDSQGRVAGNLYTVVIEPALTPVVVTPSSIAPTTQVGQPLTLQFGATGGKAPYTFSITGNLPPGTSSNSSGVLSGTPSQGGSFSFTVEATDSTGAKASRSYSLTVTGNLTITTQPPLPEGTVAKLYSVTFGVAGGRAPYTWSITGNPPPGLAFDNGTLAGTPTTAGTFSFSVSVQDSQRLSATAQFSITIWDKVEITNAPADTPLITGQPFSFFFATRGGKPPVTLAVTGGALPAGLTMSAAGVISGTPTSPGNFAFTVQATDALGNTAVQSSALRVVAPLTITTSALPAGTVGTAYSASLSATGGVAPLGAWSVSQGALPAGLSLAPDGTIAGTPTAPGQASFTVRIADSAGTAATRAFTIAVQLPPVPPIVLSGLPQTLPPGAQNNITIQLAQPFPVPVTGTLTIIFEPNAVNNADDPSVQFSSGGRTVTFTIPAGQTAGTFPVNPLRLLSGTVAGTIRIRTTTSPDSATPVPDTVVPITRSAPVITAGSAQVGTGTFTLTIDGFSNTREISSATVRLTPAAGSSLATTDVPVSVAATFTAYYQSAAAAPFGGQFRLVLPFTVNGLVTDIDTVVVTVTNSVGASQPFTVRLR